MWKQQENIKVSKIKKVTLLSISDDYDYYRKGHSVPDIPRMQDKTKTGCLTFKAWRLVRPALNMESVRKTYSDCIQVMDSSGS